jgi:CubicO group peptidase (beta-lactamase class C family)
MEANQIPGMQVSVSYKGDLVWSKGFGYSNLENNVLVDEESKFRIASVSKPVAAVLAARLYQSGAIDIDQPVNEMLYQFKGKKDFSLRHLYFHAAGIRHYLSKDTLAAKFHNDLQNGLNIIKDDTLLYTPGYKFSYSSYGYIILPVPISKK